MNLVRYRSKFYLYSDNLQQKSSLDTLQVKPRKTLVVKCYFSQKFRDPHLFCNSFMCLYDTARPVSASWGSDSVLTGCSVGISHYKNDVCDSVQIWKKPHTVLVFDGFHPLQLSVERYQ